MAIQKTRLRAKTRSGIDTIHLETSSDLVVRPDGSSVESSLLNAMNRSGILVPLGTNILTLAPGRYSVDGLTTEAEIMNLPVNAWHYEIDIIASANYESLVNNFKVIIAYPIGTKDQYINTMSYDGTWTGWIKQPTQKDLDKKANVLQREYYDKEADVNNCTTPGTHIIFSTSPNYPPLDRTWAMLTVETNGTGGYVQTATENAYSGNIAHICTRMSLNGGTVWSEWVRMIDSSNICRTNLLDNWYFVNPINQRGEINYINSYAIDRWQGQNIQVNAGYITVTSTAAAYTGMFQFIESVNIEVGSVVTLSALYRTSSSGWRMLIGRSVSSTIAAKNIPVSSDWTLISYTTTFTDFTQPTFKFDHPDIVDGDTIDIKAVKLEFGTAQTLAHVENGVWVLNEIPNRSEQLLKCQRYYNLIAKGSMQFIGLCVGASGYAIGYIHLPTNMFKIPTCTFSDISLLSSGEDGRDVYIPITSIYHQVFMTGNIVRIALEIPNNQTTLNAIYQMMTINDTGYLALSADM